MQCIEHLHEFKVPEEDHHFLRLRSHEGCQVLRNVACSVNAPHQAGSTCGQLHPAVCRHLKLQPPLPHMGSSRHAPWVTGPEGWRQQGCLARRAVVLVDPRGPCQGLQTVACRRAACPAASGPPCAAARAPCPAPVGHAVGCCADPTREEVCQCTCPRELQDRCMVHGGTAELAGVGERSALLTAGSCVICLHLGHAGSYLEARWARPGWRPGRLSKRLHASGRRIVLVGQTHSWATALLRPAPALLALLAS